MGKLKAFYLSLRMSHKVVLVVLASFWSIWISCFLFPFSISVPTIMSIVIVAVVKINNIIDDDIRS